MASNPGIDRNVLRQRVASIYSTYAPEKLTQVEEVCDRHADNPYGLLDALSIKYGPEPGAPAPAGGAAARDRAATVGGSGGRSVTMAPAGPGQAGSPSRRSASVASAGGGGGDDADELSNLRRMVADSGFLTNDHAKRWEEAWLGKIPLATVCKDQSEILIEAYGYKHTAYTKSAMFSKWQKRYFVVIPPFVYYFEKDDMAAPCRGVMYLPRADVTETEAEGRLAIEIQSRVLRKPSAKDGSLDYSAFVIRFDADRQQQVWLEALKRLSKITAKKVIAEKSQQRRDRAASMAAMREAASNARYGPPTYGTAGAGAPSGYQQQQQQALQQQQQQQAAEAASKKELPIKRQELQARIRRIAAERDPQSALDAVLDWAEEEVTDTLVLWKLMEKIELAEKPSRATHVGNTSGLQSNPSMSNPDDILRAASFIVQQQQQRRGGGGGGNDSFAPTSPGPTRPLSQGIDMADALNVPAPLPPATAGDDAPEGGEPMSEYAAQLQGPNNNNTGGGGGDGNSLAREETSALLASELSQAQMAHLRQSQAEMQRQFAEMAAMMKMTMEMQQRSVAHSSNNQPSLGPTATTPYEHARTDPLGDTPTPGRASGMMARDNGSNSLVLTPQYSTMSGGGGDHNPQQHAMSGGRYEPVDSPMPHQYQQQQQQQQQHHTPYRGQSAASHQQQHHEDPTSPEGAGGGGGGAQMQQRLERMRSRKKALDEMMRDLPA